MADDIKANDGTGSGDDEITDPLAEDGGKGFNGKKIIMFVILPLLIIVGSLTTAYFMGYLDSVLGIEIDCEQVDEDDPRFAKCQEIISAKAAGQEGATPGFYYDIPDMRVNLNTDGKQKFLFLVVKLELPDQANMDKVELYIPRIVDHFQTYLRELRVEDLQGSTGIYRLRLELLERVNAAAPDLDVRDVLFQEMLVQ